MLPSEIKIETEDKSKSVKKVQRKNLITVVVDVHNAPATQQPIAAARNIVEKPSIVKSKSVVDYDCIEICESQSNIDLERKESGDKVPNTPVIQQPVPTATVNTEKKSSKQFIGKFIFFTKIKKKSRST